MIKAAARLQEETRPRPFVALKINYTRQATRFGYNGARTSSGAVLWRCEATGAMTKFRPRCATLLKINNHLLNQSLSQPANQLIILSM